MLEIYPWLVFLASLLFITFGLFVYFNNKHLPDSRPFLFLSASFALWGYAWYGMLITQEHDAALLFAKLLSVGAALIPVFYFHWIISVLNLRKKYRYVTRFFYLITIILLPITSTSYYVVGIYKVFGEFYWPLAGSFYFIYIIFGYMGITGWAFALLMKEFHGVQGERKHQIGLIIAGSLLGFGGGLTNFPLMYGFSFPPFGIIMTLASPAILGYAAARYHLFNLKILLTELFAIALGIFFLLNFIISRSQLWHIVDATLLASVLFLSIFLIRGVRGEVKARERIEKLAGEIAMANEKLRQLEKQKSEFVSIASHQLRTPLTAIKGYASMLLEGSFGALSDGVRGAVEKIYKSSQTLVVVIEDFLMVSRIEQGRMRYEFARVDMRGIVSGVAREMEEDARAKGLSLQVQAEDAGDLFVRADEAKMRQVAFNVIKNAVKYTESGFVKILLSKNNENGKIRIAVSDTGMGISKELMPKLFHKFTKGEKSGRIGSGIGLYVAKEIVNAHNGEIWAESPGIGRGATFFVELTESNA